MTEFWLSVGTWEGRYEVSSEGRVRSHWCRRSRVLKPHPGKGGYLNLTLSDRAAGRLETHRVHLLVAEAFHGPRPGCLQCAHLNGNNQDNRSSNLAWKTRVENEADKVLHGTDNRGERNGQVKLSADDVKYIRYAYKSPYWGLGTILAERFGVSKTTICQVRKGNRWAWLEHERDNA